MSIEGRVIIDALFYDRDGTAALNVLSLNDATTSTSGVAAIVTGTVSIGTIELPTNGYRNASGQIAYPSSPKTLVFRHSGNCIVTQPDDTGSFTTRMVLQPNKAVVMHIQPDWPVYIQSISTGTYAAIVYGEI